jgi:hypothetical protein
MNNEVIIARYAENLDWVTDIPPEFSVVVYNKGAPITSEAVLGRVDKLVALPNSGRESDTFLRHVLDKRDFGDGYTVFLQGDPFEHSPDIIRLLGLHPSWEAIQPLSWRWLANEKRPPRSILDRETGNYLKDARVRAEVFSLTTWMPLQFFDAGSRWLDDEYRRAHRLPDGVNIAAHFLRLCDWDDLAERAEQHMIGRFSYGALFAVRQSLLRELPARSLTRAMEAANGHPTYGYVLERLWLHMCGEPFLLPAPDALAHGRRAAPTIKGFVPRTPASKPLLTRRFVPAAKKRILAWALS